MIEQIFFDINLGYPQKLQNLSYSNLLVYLYIRNYVHLNLEYSFMILFE